MPISNPPTASSGVGRELMALRKSLGLRTIDVAAAIGVSRTRITAIENQVHVSRTVITRYRAGLRRAARIRKSTYSVRKRLSIPEYKTAGVSTLPAVSEVRRGSGKPRI